VTDQAVSLDGLARSILARHPYRFVLADDDASCDVAYRLRYEAVVEHGWRDASAMADERERDEYDPRAVHVIAWDHDTPVATGRIVLPPGPLPTEDACGIRVEPAGRVVDVGRMTVASSHQSAGHPLFMALLARLYLEVRARDYDTACGLMSPRARSLMRLLGLKLDLLGPDRPYWGEPRAPVRFSVFVNATPSPARWPAGA
jgi:N-acyl-L-homoserine lactone synthetase